jgi:hypothetical protein
VLHGYQGGEFEESSFFGEEDVACFAKNISCVSRSEEKGKERHQIKQDRSKWLKQCQFSERERETSTQTHAITSLLKPDKTQRVSHIAKVGIMMRNNDNKNDNKTSLPFSFPFYHPCKDIN